MNTDRIPEDRLFQNNTKEEIVRWSNGLQYFHYMRDRGGHRCEGDSFCVYFKFGGREDLIAKLSRIGVVLNQLGEGDIVFDPFESYSIDDLDKLKITIPWYKDLEQPQYVGISEHKAHIWVMDDSFEISVSGTKAGNAYKVSEEDYEVCLMLEKEFDKLGWKPMVDESIKSHAHCVSRDKYPELYP